jgi:hypothetical protein
MNKRFIYILIEYFLHNFCIANTNQQQHQFTSQQLSIANPVLLPHSPMNVLLSPSLNSNLISSPLINLIRLHLSKSSKVKSEWKLIKKSSSETNCLSQKVEQQQQHDTNNANESKKNFAKMHSHSMNFNSSFAEADTAIIKTNNLKNIPKSKSFFGDL